MLPNPKKNENMKHCQSARDASPDEAEGDIPMSHLSLRQNQILALARQAGSVGVEELARLVDDLMASQKAFLRSSI